MKNITYLLGAGASAGCIPVVSGIEGGMAQMLFRFADHSDLNLSDEAYFENCSDKTKRTIQLNFLESLKWLMKECGNHASIDTYAKKLYLRKEGELLRKLKVTLSIYLVFEQCQKGFDKRYDSFFASIVNDSVYSLPGHIKVISWNYDYQLERAYAEYTGDFRHDSIADSLNIHSKGMRPEGVARSKFGICKLNGSAFIKQDNFYQFEYADSLNSNLNLTTVESAMRNYSLLLFSNDRDCTPALSFAWEHDSDKDNNIISKAKLLTNHTNILVVIGYSFPFFNRQVDREILGDMGYLEKVYIQSPDANGLCERFESVRPDMTRDKIIARLETGQFLLPNEL